jgi:VWFA-related protein
MRTVLTAAAAGLLVLAALPAGAQQPRDVPYTIAIKNVLPVLRERDGNRALYVTVQFQIKHRDGSIATDVGKDQLVVREDGVRVDDLDIYQPQGNDRLTTVLALDCSGSMGEHDDLKMKEARRAAITFLDRLSDRFDSGLILFNHEILQPTDPPLQSRELFAAHRQQLRARIRAARASGGTAYLDATLDAVEMLRPFEGRRAVLLMTDGVDLNSKHELYEVTKRAQATGVPVYTLGVGEPGKKEPVSSVLVLDHSGSMSQPADQGDSLPKIQALQRAASRFVEIMRPAAQTKLLPFGSDVDRPYLPLPFSADKKALKEQIATLKAGGGTALYDATFDGIETLEAARPAGKWAVVVLTDGVDEAPGSRHRVEDVIARAREAKTPLYMLALGRPGEFNEPVMRKMAQETGGKFFHARNQKELIDLFEQLSIDLHDEGIDEESLKKLAHDTGGEYYPARDVTRLQFIYQQLADELQSTYTVTFPSRRQSHDGTARGIDIVIEQGGRPLSAVASADYNVHGVVVPGMDARVYLVLLVLVGGLLLAPAGVRRLYRFYGGV